MKNLTPEKYKALTKMDEALYQAMLVMLDKDQTPIQIEASLRYICLYVERFSLLTNADKVKKWLVRHDIVSREVSMLDLLASYTPLNYQRENLLLIEQMQHAKRSQLQELCSQYTNNCNKITHDIKAREMLAKRGHVYHEF
jgi:hypothetical protein